MTSTRTVTRSVALIVALAAIALAVFGAAKPAEAGPNVTGTWAIDATGDLPGECTSVILQDGTSLVSYTECSIVGTLTFEGTIDPATGAFSMTDTVFAAVIEGTFSADGNSVTATYTALGGTINGGLTGTRTSTDVSPVDLTGDWTFVYEGRDDGDDVCDASLVQDFLDLTATITCPSGTVIWTGTVNPMTGEFGLRADDSFASDNIYAGPLDDGSGILVGTWYTREDLGHFYALPAGAGHNGILSLSCGESFPGYCSAPLSETILVDVDLVLPPTDGFDGFEIVLRSNGSVPYAPAEDPASETPGCSAPERRVDVSTDATTITFSCAPGAVVPGAKPLIRLAFACPDDGLYNFSRITLLSEGTSLSQGGVQVTPYLAGASGLDCYDAFPNPEPIPYLPPEAFLAADVNCDGRPDAIDAALVLQLDAGLIGGLPCGNSGDSSMDGDTNSIDASVILQMVAGLVLPAPEPLPGPLARY